MYSLFQKIGNRWVRRENTGAYAKNTAIRVFQSILIYGDEKGRYELRKVKEEKKEKVS